MTSPFSNHEVANLKFELEHARARLNQIQSQTAHTGIILAKHGDRCMLAIFGGPMMETACPKELEAGDTVTSNQQGQIVKKHFAELYGSTATAGNRVGDMIEILDQMGNANIVFLKKGLEIRPGDRVVLDMTRNIVLAKGERQEGKRFEAQFFDDLGWDDIGGQEEAKEALREVAEYPFLNPELFKTYGAKQPRGAMLHGRPGCGKTILGRALATSLRSGGRRGGFYYIKGPQLINELVGKSERDLRELFATARDEAGKDGFSVIFFDEADAMFGERTGARFHNMEKTMVPTFLAELDGIESNSGVIVLLATNRPDAIDPAVLRDGRIDHKIAVEPPKTKEEVKVLFDIHFKSPRHGEYTNDKLVDRVFEAEVFEGKIEMETGGGVATRKVRVVLSDVVTGAVVRGICEKATMSALKRDVKNKVKTPVGVTLDDFATAIKQECKSVHPSEVQLALSEQMQKLGAR